MGTKTAIAGSSRNNGNTSYYDYNSKNKEDDFLPLIKRLIENYETFVFSTPVYWYSMSRIMKFFLDRLSNFVRIEKEKGRKLRGKRIGVISNSGETKLDSDFYIPFKKSAEYLGMKYGGDTHLNSEKINSDLKLEFINNYLP